MAIWPEGKREEVLRHFNNALVSRYGLPRHGNKRNPLDEIIYILLSSQTDERKYQESYRTLKRTFRSWKYIDESHETQIADILGPAGLSKTKAKRLISILLKVENDFGFRTLAPLKGMSDQEVEKYLCSLEGIGKKSARCVMMYSFGRDVFPVDTHAFRVLKRAGLHDFSLPERRWHDKIQDLIPPIIRYSLHVTLISLGRKTCKAFSPRCVECPVSGFCLSRSGN